MLLKFAVTNFLSFQARTVFSMTATGGGRLVERVQQHPNLGKKILPVAGIYGAPGSGAENLGEALLFFKTLATGGEDCVETLKRHTMGGAPEGSYLPVKLKLEILARGKIYRYGFAAQNGEFLEERLEIPGKKNRAVLFERGKKTTFINDESENLKRLEEVALGLSRSKLFLPLTVMNGIPDFLDVYDWFDDTLRVSLAGSGRESERIHFGGEKAKSFADFISLIDRQPHTASVNGLTTLPDNPVHLEWNKEKLIGSGQHVMRVNEETNDIEVFYRQKSDNSESFIQIHPFDERQEKKRCPVHRPFVSEEEKKAFVSAMILVDLAFSQPERVYVNTHLYKHMEIINAYVSVSDYLGKCGKDSFKQLIMTVNSALVLDKSVFRPDEIWISERGYKGETILRSMSDYKRALKHRDFWKGIGNKKSGGLYPALHIAALAAGKA
ncbi:MAG: hypothetical protein LBR53_11110 [Deltaproteobacteria bacterium]|jgi:hypothetical protein|nr:hypothetical protein [Deltaproteobacteria bacterium]